jgi:O-antigen polymerase
MQSLLTSDNGQSKLLLVGLTLLFMIVPFYSYPNQGWPSLALPYNTSVWSIDSWIVATGILLLSVNKQFSYPRLWPFFLAFPIIVILSSLLAETPSPIDWLFRQLFILGGLFFLFALFQFKIKQKVLDNFLLIIVLATGLQALLGAMQIIAPESLPLWFPKSNDTVPRGMFQQVNVLASYLATGLVTALYLISRPSFRFSSKLIQLCLVVCFTLSVYVIIASGSRVGLLSMLLSIPVVLLSRYQQLRPHKLLLVILFITSCCGIGAGQVGLHKTMDKSVQLTDGRYSSARIAMYSIGLELVEQEPLHGYGLGGFLGAWNKQSSDFVTRHPEVVLPAVVTHPHNEILFWMIEGGLLVVAGIIAVIIGIMLALFRCGFQRGGAYAAMLIPISLHTQVEHPLYTSSLHWFLWLFLIYLLLRHQINTVDTSLSQVATRLIQLIAILLAVGIPVFMYNTARAQSDLFDFLYDKHKQPPYLQLALNNIYTKTMAEKIAMRSMLYASIENDDKSKVQTFENWALDYVDTRPELKMYEDLISASVFLRPEGKGCDAIAAGRAMYAHNKPLQLAYDKCQ